MDTNWSRNGREIPAAYWLTATLASLAVLVCYLTAWWVPLFMADWGRMFVGLPVPIGFFVAGFGGLLGVAVASASWLALRWPWLALCVAVLPVVPSLLDGTPLHFGVVAGLGAVALTAGWRRPDASVAAVVVAALVVTGWLVTASSMAAPFRARIDIDLYSFGQRWTLGLLYGVALLLVLAGAMWLRTSQLRAAEAGALAARSSAVEEQAAVVGERARLARDLHDVVAHHVSLIAVRAETAPYTEPDLPPAARRVLTDIAGDARLALDELRGVLGILGRSSAAGARSPQPAWSDIAALVERTRSAGAEVSLAGDVEAATGAAEGYAAYRVVQESLTNARRHAPGRPVGVSLQATSALLVVRVVTTSGRSTDRPDVTSGGQGLVGMRERVEALGGRLEAGPLGEDFVVEATLPRGHA